MRQAEKTDLTITETPINAIEANFQIKCWDRKKIEVAGMDLRWKA